MTLLSDNRMRSIEDELSALTKSVSELWVLQLSEGGVDNQVDLVLRMKTLKDQIARMTKGDYAGTRLVEGEK